MKTKQIEVEVFKWEGFGDKIPNWAKRGNLQYKYWPQEHSKMFQEDCVCLGDYVVRAGGAIDVFDQEEFDRYFES